MGRRLMSGLLTWIVLIAAAFTALGFLIKKVIVPGYKGVGAIEDALPVFKEFTTTFRGNTDVFTVIRDIAQQFRTDSGSSLRDAVDNLSQMAEANRVNTQKAAEVAQRAADVAQQASEDNRRANESLSIRFEAQRQLDEHRAVQQERLLLQSDRLMIRVDQMMIDRATVASDLTERQRQIDEASSGVASDLAAARQRADDTPGDSTAGTAADAASQTPETDR